MGFDPQEQKFWATEKRVAVMEAEMEGRLAALQGGARWDQHSDHVLFLAAKIWDLRHGHDDGG